MLKIVPAICVVLLVCGCANLQGVPVGLTDAQETELIGADRTKALAVAHALSNSYRQARDDNLKYAYWSNVPFVGAAAAAAGAVYYKAHKDVLAGIGIFAGTLAGFNTLTNARANAKVYQAGIGALTCVRTKLGGYTNAGTLGAQINSLNGAINNAQGAVVASKLLLDGGNAAANAERAANPTIGAAQMAAQNALEQAYRDAETILEGAAEELRRFEGIAGSITDAITGINTAVSAKITQPDISFAAMATQLLDLTKPPAGGAKPAAAPQPASLGPTTPIADAIGVMKKALEVLQPLATALKEAISKFGLTSRLKEVDNCVKAV